MPPDTAVFPSALGLLLLWALLGIVFFFVIRWLLRHRASPIAQIMVKHPSCPSAVRLKAFLDAQAPDKEVSDHVDICDRCQDRLDMLLASREPWPAIPLHLKKTPPTQDFQLRRAMENLKANANKSASEDAAPADKEEGLDFLSPSDKPGQLGRLGPYEVLEVIGHGGMGIVLKALDPSLHRVVAIKVLAPQLATSGTARRRFTREAQAAAAVSHDHVVTIHAVEEANGIPYLVMQYIAGMSLQERLDQGGPLELKEILRIGMQTAAGLAAAHAQGLVHRDIKPANILLENGVQRVKITDFGLARAADDASLTQSGVVAGTPQYMAPEQARGEAVDHRADLFSLGSVLYAMCTGRPPFCASTAMAVLRRVSDDTPRPTHELNPEIPKWLIAIVEKLHAKNPAARFQSAREVAELLNDQLARLQQAAWTPAPGPRPDKSMETATGADAPITNLIICPSCGSHLHVPDSKNGCVMNCPQCGKAFQMPDAAQEIQIMQTAKARFREGQGPSRPTSAQGDGGADSGAHPWATVIPYRNPLALIAYYLGVFGLIPCMGLLLGPAALIFGILGLRFVRAHPTARGTAHAIMGIVLGAIEMLFNWGTIILYLLSAAQPPAQPATLQSSPSHDGIPANSTSHFGTTEASPKGVPPSYEEALSWFPADATFSGIIDIVQVWNWGPYPADLEIQEKLLDRLLGPHIRRQLSRTPGIPRVHRVSFAYREDTQRPETSTLYVRLTGQFERQQLLSVLGRETPRWRIQELVGFRTPTAIIHAPNTPLVCGLIGDTDVILAGHLGAGKTASDHLIDDVLQLRDGHGTSLAKARAMDLQLAPPRACGLLIGRIPGPLGKQSWVQTLFPVLPQHLTIYLAPVANVMPPDFQLSWELRMKEPGQDREFVSSVARLKREGVDMLVKAYPQIADLNVGKAFRDALETIQIDADQGVVSGDMRLGRSTVHALGVFVKHGLARD